ncbi:MAG TPA: hypothetical protein VLL94_04490, partial [Nitrospiraceae bacterium]|nr:hypothetical protein [Nitrospiraceae bacterium]
EAANKLHDELMIDGARDVILRDQIPLSTFKEIAGKNGWIKEAMTDSWFQTEGGDYLVTNQRETNEKTPVNTVKLYQYMNVHEDLYIVVANKRTIYEGSISKDFGTYCFPLADYTFEPRNDSYWGNNLAQLIAPHIYLKDTLINLEIMNLKLTLQPVLAVSGDFGFNRKLHKIQPGGVWQAQSSDGGKIGDKIVPVVAGNPNTKVYDMLQNVNSELTITARSDIRSLEYNKSDTATGIVAQDRSMNVHNETVESLNEIEGEAKVFEIMNDQMIAFMDEKNDDKRARKVPIKGYVAIRNDAGVEFMEKSGYEDIFELSERMINCEVDIEESRHIARRRTGRPAHRRGARDSAS